MKLPTFITNLLPTHQTNLDKLTAQLATLKDEHQADIAAGGDGLAIWRRLTTVEGQIAAARAAVQAAQQVAANQAQDAAAAEHARLVQAYADARLELEAAAVDFEQAAEAMSATWPAVTAAAERWHTARIAAGISDVTGALRPFAIWSRVMSRVGQVTKQGFPGGVSPSKTVASVAQTIEAERNDRAHAAQSA